MIFFSKKNIKYIQLYIIFYMKNFQANISFNHGATICFLKGGGSKKKISKNNSKKKDQR